MELFRTVISVTALALAGCAATQKPAMPEAYYSTFAARWVAVHQCMRTGQLAPETAALGARYISADVSAWSYDSARLDSYVKHYDESETTPASVCNHTAMQIAAKKQSIDQHNAMVAQDQKAWADMLNSNKPVRANCHQIGSQTVCDSY